MWFDPAFVLALWGAILSTGLAALRVWEFATRGPSLVSRRHFSPSPEQGNTITIENTSATPAMISYWELVWVSGRHPPFNEKRRVGSPDARSPIKTMTIAPHSTVDLLFSGQEYFGWGAGTESMGRLFLKLHMAGRRKPRWLFVYDPKEPIV